MGPEMTDEGVNPQARVLQLDESAPAAAGEVPAGVDTLSLVNGSGEDVDAEALAGALARWGGMDRIAHVRVAHSSRLRDLRVLRALPGARTVLLYGKRVRSLSGLESLRPGGLLYLEGGAKGERDLGALAGAALETLTLCDASPAELDVISRCTTLRSLHLVRAPELDLDAWREVPLEFLRLTGVAGAVIRDTERLPPLRRLWVEQSRKLERFEGRCRNVTGLSVESCPRLDWRTVRVFPALRGLVTGGSKPFPLGALEGLPELREALLHRAEAGSLDELGGLSPHLVRLYAGGLKAPLAQALSAARPALDVDTGSRCFKAGARVPGPAPLGGAGPEARTQRAAAGAARTTKGGAGERPPRAGSPMDRMRFWSVIEDARAGAPAEDRFLERLGQRLRALSPEELAAFARHFAELHAASFGWPLWGAAYLILGGCSDDGFEDFRAWLIAQGRGVYEAAVGDPDSLAALRDPEGTLEELLYLPAQVHEETTGRALPDDVAEGVTRPDLGDGWDLDDRAEMKRRYPRLYRKYCARR